MATGKDLLLSCGILLGVFLGLAECVHFEFGDGQQTCILLDLEAEFNLSMGSQYAAPFSIDGANVTSGNSLCGTGTAAAILSLTLFPSNELLRINFRRDLDLQTVHMSVILNLDPKKHFENASEILPVELEDSDDLPIGLMNSSFKCISEEQIFFNQDPGYSMTMTITNLQVQAYNIVDRKYGEAIVCDQDMLTTKQTTTNVPETTTMNEITTQSSTMTTVPETTMMNETTTTMAPETTTFESPSTTEQETTTVMPTTSESPTTTEQETTSATPEPETTTAPKTIPKYTVTDGKTVCIVFQGEIRFNINYKTNDSEDAVQSITVPENATSEGQCAVRGDNSTQEFKLKFFDTWTFSVIIEQDEPNVLETIQVRALQAGPSYAWKKVELIYVIDNNFVNPQESDIGTVNNVTKEEDEGDFRANADGSYKCGSGETIDLNDAVRMDLGDFQYRAFGQDSSEKFTGADVAECPADSGDDDDDGDTLAIVLGSVFGGIALIVIVVVAVFLLRKNKHKDYEVM